MSRERRQVTRTLFEPGTYSARRYHRSETCEDVYLPAPEGPFNVLRFKIGQDDTDQVTVTVHFGGPAMIASWEEACNGPESESDEVPGT